MTGRMIFCLELSFPDFCVAEDLEFCDMWAPISKSEVHSWFNTSEHSDEARVPKPTFSDSH